MKLNIGVHIEDLFEFCLHSLATVGKKDHGENQIEMPDISNEYSNVSLIFVALVEDSLMLVKWY